MAYTDTFHSVSGEIVPIEIYTDSVTMLKVPGSFVNLKTFIHTYENRWGACCWQRVGYVVVPFNSGAMEHATNIAYPRIYVDGTIADQDLISHELAHSWFGNLITCSNSQNMWINEGFARYGEYLCHEVLDPTLQKYKTGIRNLHFKVLRSDKGQYALDNMPPSQTYNTTITYDKGGLVAYTLRNYMGDSLYFSSIKQFLDENKYTNVTSEEFFEKLSQISGMDLMDFFLGWVHQKGLLNFNIDYIKNKNESDNIYQVFFKQRLYFAEYFANNNKVDVEFVSASGERKLIEKLQFSGEIDTVDVELPFEPIFWAIDPNSKMSDACYDYTHQINKTGTFSSGDANFTVLVYEINDTAILRVEHNPVAPTEAQNLAPDILRISDKHFWRVGFFQYSKMQAEYSFLYNKAYDQELLKGFKKENLILLFRKDVSQDWQIISAIITGDSSSGKITVNQVLPGEYTLGIGEYLPIKELDNSFEVYPNPTTGNLQVQSSKFKVQSVEIFDVNGKKQKVALPSVLTDEEWSLNISDLSAGVYLVKIKTEKGIIIKKVIKH
jgi:aminopeptidase N